MSQSISSLIVITGVGRAGQMGEALARHFAAQGASLALLDRGGTYATELAAELAAEWQSSHPAQRFTGHAADLSDAASAQHAAAAVLALHHTTAVHGAVCTAGGFGMTGPLSHADPDAWHKQFAINLDTAFSTTRAFLPALREGKGSLVYFGSAAALPEGNTKGMAAYAAAKSGVLTLMRSVAADERKNGVRANAVAPTAIRTATNIADMGDKTAYVERESVAEVIAFLLSGAARNVTGQVLKLS